MRGRGRRPAPRRARGRRARSGCRDACTESVPAPGRRPRRPLRRAPTARSSCQHAAARYGLAAEPDPGRPRGARARRPGGARRVPARRRRARVVRRRRPPPAPAPLARRAAQGGRAGRRRHARPLPAALARHRHGPAAAPTRSSTWWRSSRARRSWRRPSTATSSGRACPSTSRPTSTRCARRATWCGWAPGPSAPPTAASAWPSATRPGCCCPPVEGFEPDAAPHRAARPPRARAAPRSGPTSPAPRSRPASPSTTPPCSPRCGTSCGRASSRTTRWPRCAPSSAPSAGARRAASSVTSRRARPSSTRPAGSPRARPPAPAAGRSWRRCSSRVPTATEAAHARALQLLERYGVLTREAALGEGAEGGFAGVYPVLKALEERGQVRRGYFVAGLGAAQFAVAGRGRPAPAARRTTTSRPPVVLAATDPAQPFGAADPVARVAPAVPARAAGALVVLAGRRRPRLPRAGRPQGAALPGRHRRRPLGRRAGRAGGRRAASGRSRSGRSTASTSTRPTPRCTRPSAGPASSRPTRAGSSEPVDAVDAAQSSV